MSAEPGPLPAEVAAAVHRLDDLVRAFDNHPDATTQDLFVEVLRTVDVLHRGALRRLAALLEARGLRAEALADPQVALLFDLYGRDDDDDDDERSRAEDVVARVRPLVEAHGGRIEVVAAEDGVVTIRLLGAAEPRSEPAAALRGLVEEALRAELPEFVRMDLTPPPPRQRPGPVLIPLSALNRSGPAQQAQGGCASGHDCGSQSYGRPSCR
jgi:Fe-S cluster biogenesis protein NfuA